MGCDIHAYVEYSDDGKYWRSLTRNFGSRDYVMFGVIAGVRYEEAKLFEPKGMPDGPLSYVTEDDYWYRVAPAKNPEWADLDGWTSKERAQDWVARGISKPEYKGDELSRVTNPDAHSHSWLTADELAQALAHYVTAYSDRWDAETAKAPTEWLMILAAMQAANAAGAQSRIIFWFDN